MPVCSPKTQRNPQKPRHPFWIAALASAESFTRAGRDGYSIMAMADALNAPLRLKDDALVDALVGVMVPPIRAA